MPAKRPKKEWADPSREGKGNNRQAERFCAKCGNTVRQTRILKSWNLCEYCVNELREARDGINSCRGCGKIAPSEIKEHHGYCAQCVCSACGKPDPQYVRQTGFCFQCAAALGDFCRSCGKEAAAQVRKNKGFCDECMANNRYKTLGRPRRSTGYQGKTPVVRRARSIIPVTEQSPTGFKKVGIKSFASDSKRDVSVTQGKKQFPEKSGNQKHIPFGKPGLKRSSRDESKNAKPMRERRKPFGTKTGDNGKNNRVDRGKIY